MSLSPPHFDLWDLRDHALVHYEWKEGGNVVWHVNTENDHEPIEAAFKFINPAKQQDERLSGSMLDYYAGQGAVRLLKQNDEGQLLEWASGGTLGNQMELFLRNKGGLNDERATLIIADTVKQLHAPREVATIPQGLMSLEERFRSLFDRAAEDKAQGLTTIFTRASDLTRSLLKTTIQEIPLHGDIHHDNIVHSSEREWLAIDPKGVLGDAAYDVSNVFCNPVDLQGVVKQEGRIERLAHIFAQKLGYDETRILGWAAVHAALSACWSLEDGRMAEANHRLAVSERALVILNDRAPALIAA